MPYVIGFILGLTITAIFFVIRHKKILQKINAEHKTKLEAELRYSNDEHHLELQSTISKYKLQIQEIQRLNSTKLQDTIKKINAEHKSKLESELRYANDEHHLELQGTISQYKLQIQEIQKLNIIDLQDTIKKINVEHKNKLESELRYSSEKYCLELQSLQKKHELGIKEIKKFNEAQLQKQATIIFVETLVKIWTDSEQINNLTATYACLKNYLSNKEWEKADKETATIIFNACNPKNSYLEIEEITSLSPEMLLTIDSLWLYYSHNCFGLSIQYAILSNNTSNISLIDEEWRKIGSLLGWNKNGAWISGYNQLICSQDAPRGQFPFFVLWKGAFWVNFMDSQSTRFTCLMGRFSDCKLDFR